MTIKTFKRVAPLMPPDTSILLRANHGVGKSQVVRQVSALIRAILAKKGVIKDAGTEYPVIDRRLSQMTEGDMVGLPSTDGEVTRFNPPDWYKKACNQPCALFLDELNRATPEVMQAAFQIVLDRELNGWKLHPESRVYSAINASAAYTVNEMDPALLDRFWAIDISPTQEEFVEWARNTDPVQGGNLHTFIPDFITTTPAKTGESWLYPPKNYEPGTVTVSPRSWEKLNNSLVYAGLIEQPENELFYHMCVGFIGIEGAIAFRDFCKNVDSRITGEDVVERYHEKKVKAKCSKFQQGRQNDLVAKVSDYVTKNVDKLNDQQGKNVREFMQDIPEELKISLWSQLTKQGIDKIDLAKSIHKHCADLVLGVFGVPMGEAGIGVVPNIPGIFKAPAKEGKK